MKIHLAFNEELTIASCAASPDGYKTYRIYCDEVGVLHVTDTTQDLNEEERGLVEAGGLIKAIKKYKMRTGAKLVQAKDLCVGYREGLRGS